MKTKEIIQYAFSIAIILFTLTWFGMLFFVVVPEGNKSLIDTVAGVFLGSGWTQILNYWFGSSKGSADKSELMAKQRVDENAIEMAEIKKPCDEDNK